jgi:hypothetical protein
MLNPDARAELLVHAVGLTLNELAPDCLSSASLGDADDTSVVVRWHTDGVHGAGDLPPVWLPIGSAVVDARGIEVLAQEIVGSEVARHRLDDHPERE